MSEPEILPD